MDLLISITGEGVSIVAHHNGQTYFVDRCARDEALGELASWLYCEKPHYGRTVHQTIEQQRRLHEATIR